MTDVSLPHLDALCLFSYGGFSLLMVLSTQKSSNKSHSSKLVGHTRSHQVDENQLINRSAEIDGSLNIQDPAQYESHLALSWEVAITDPCQQLERSKKRGIH